MRIEVLPAAFGDCLLVSWGSGESTHRMLIDAGLTKTYHDALAPRLEVEKRVVDLEVLVVTHIDRDHIAGVLPLLGATPRLVSASDIWFNGYPQLVESDNLGPKEGEALGKLLAAEKLPWNRAFGGRAVVVPDTGPLPTVELAGGATITLLSPRRAKLAKLLAFWSDELGTWDAPAAPAPPVAGPSDLLGKRAAITRISVADVESFTTEPFEEDTTAPNGSSIAFLLEHDRKRVLFGADAHPSELLHALERHSPGKTVEIDAFKLSHHGSENNLSPKLLEKIVCPRFIVSTNGDSFGHPHAQAISRLLCLSGPKKTLYFNYASDYTSVWDDRDVLRKFGCEVVYPDSRRGGVVIEL